MLGRIMKPTISLLLVLCSVGIWGCADTQQEFHINKMGQDEAVSLASHLKYGMSDLLKIQPLPF